jgi:hypothetical protein
LIPVKTLTRKTAPQTKGEETKPKRNLTRKQVLLIGTSNLKYVNSRFVAGSKAYVYKVQKFTVDEALRYIQEEKPEADFDPHVVIYHLLCNDVGKYDKDALTKQMKNLVTAPNRSSRTQKSLYYLVFQGKIKTLTLMSTL